MSHNFYNKIIVFNTCLGGWRYTYFLFSITFFLLSFWGHLLQSPAGLLIFGLAGDQVMIAVTCWAAFSSDTVLCSILARNCTQWRRNIKRPWIVFPLLRRAQTPRYLKKGFPFKWMLSYCNYFGFASQLWRYGAQ